jgi:hypothetical protein
MSCSSRAAASSNDRVSEAPTLLKKSGGARAVKTIFMNLFLHESCCGNAVTRQQEFETSGKQNQTETCIGPKVAFVAR